MPCPKRGNSFTICAPCWQKPSPTSSNSRAPATRRLADNPVGRPRGLPAGRGQNPVGQLGTQRLPGHPAGGAHLGALQAGYHPLLAQDFRTMRALHSQGNFPDQRKINHMKRPGWSARGRLPSASTSPSPRPWQLSSPIPTSPPLRLPP